MHPIFLGGGSLDPDAARWIASVGQTNVSQPRGKLISDTIRELKAANVWSDIDYLLVLTAENSASALVDWKSRKTCLEVSSPTFTADRGYQFNGTTSYLNTQFICSADCIAATGTNFGVSFYDRENVASSGNSFGGNSTSTRTIRFANRNASNTFQAALNASFVILQTGVTDSRGFWAAQSDGVNASGFKNGASTGAPVALTTPGSVLTPREIFVGCYNSGGTPTSFRAGTAGALSVHKGLSSAQHLSFYTIMQRYMTKLGANV